MVRLRKRLKDEAKAKWETATEAQDVLKRKVIELTAANLAQKIQIGAFNRTVRTGSTETVKVVTSPSVLTASPSAPTARGPRPVVASLTSAPAFGGGDSGMSAVQATKEMEKMKVTKGVSSFLEEEFSSSDDESE